jgi:hypothetical protein
MDELSCPVVIRKIAGERLAGSGTSRVRQMEMTILPGFAGTPGRPS